MYVTIASHSRNTTLKLVETNQKIRCAWNCFSKGKRKISIKSYSRACQGHRFLNVFGVKGDHRIVVFLYATPLFWVKICSGPRTVCVNPLKLGYWLIVKISEWANFLDFPNFGTLIFATTRDVFFSLQCTNQIMFSEILK